MCLGLRQYKSSLMSEEKSEMLLYHVRVHNRTIETAGFFLFFSSKGSFEVGYSVIKYFITLAGYLVRLKGLFTSVEIHFLFAFTHTEIERRKKRGEEEERIGKKKTKRRRKKKMERGGEKEEKRSRKTEESRQMPRKRKRQIKRRTKD